MEVACPHCGHSQKEPRTAISTNCRKCGGHFLLEELLKPAKKTRAPAAVKKAATLPERRKISCFECGSALEVALTAQSTMCKRCSQYIDLKDYHIANAVSKNFKTKGSFALEPTGYVFNTEAIVGDAVIKGRFLGKLITEGSLTLYTTAEIKGSFKTARLIIPAANHFRWKEQIKAGSAEIAGELTANVRAEGTIVVKGTGRLFGDVEAGGLVVEDGAVVVGSLKIGRHG